MISEWKAYAGENDKTSCFRSDHLDCGDFILVYLPDELLGGHKVPKSNKIATYAGRMGRGVRLGQK